MLGSCMLEFLPLGLFFVFTERYDVYVGTGVMMGATVVSHGGDLGQLAQGRADGAHHGGDRPAVRRHDDLLDRSDCS